MDDYVPTPERFGLDASIYGEYRIKKESLEIVKEQLIGKIRNLEKDLGFFQGVLGFGFTLALISIGVLIYGLEFSVLIRVSLFLLCVWLLVKLFLAFESGTFSLGTMLPFREHSESRSELNKVEKELENLKKIIDEKFGPFEEAFHSYYKERLDEFFATRLYKKRSGSRDFEESLGEFGLMLETLINANKVLLTHPFSFFEENSLWSYQEYFNKRRTDHNVQLTRMKNLDFASATNFIEKASRPVLRRNIVPEVVYRTPRKIDWTSLNQDRTKTGIKGEEIVMKLEQEFLQSIGRNDLADAVKHVSKESGDGLGYDILSYFSNGREKYIEVKSTTGSLEKPFYISRNELGFLEEHKDDGFVYRVGIMAEGEYLQVLGSDDVLKKSEIIPIQFLVKR